MANVFDKLAAERKPNVFDRLASESTTAVLEPQGPPGPTEFERLQQLETLGQPTPQEQARIDVTLQAADQPTQPDIAGRFPPPETVDNRIGFVEQIGREFDSLSDIGKKLPIAGGAVGAGESFNIFGATKRLTANFDYETKPKARTSLETEALEAIELETGKPLGFSKQADIKAVVEYLERVNEEQERGFSFGGQVARGISVLPTWMLEFMLTGGLAKIGSATAQKAGTKVLKGYAASKAGQAALRAAGWTGGAITRASIGLSPRIAEKTVGRQLEAELGLRDPETPFTSFAKAWGDTVIEAASEEAGEAITGGLKIAAKGVFGKKFVSGLEKAFLAQGGTKAGFLKQTLTKAGYSNLIGELGEEQLGKILKAITDVEDFGAGKDANMIERLAAAGKQALKDIPVEATVLAVPGATQAALSSQMQAANSDIAKETADKLVEDIEKVEATGTEPLSFEEREFIKGFNPDVSDAQIDGMNVEKARARINELKDLSAKSAETLAQLDQEARKTPVTTPQAVQDAPKEVKPTVTAPKAVKPLEKPKKGLRNIEATRDIEKIIKGDRALIQQVIKLRRQGTDDVDILKTLREQQKPEIGKKLKFTEEERKELRIGASKEDAKTASEEFQENAQKEEPDELTGFGAFTEWQKAISDIIDEEAGKHGLETSKQRAGTGTEYVDVQQVDEEGDIIGDFYRIRVSDHPSRGTDAQGFIDIQEWENDLDVVITEINKRFAQPQKTEIAKAQVKPLETKQEAVDELEVPTPSGKSTETIQITKSLTDDGIEVTTFGGEDAVKLSRRKGAGAVIAFIMDDGTVMASNRWSHHGDGHQEIDFLNDPRWDALNIAQSGFISEGKWVPQNVIEGKQAVTPKPKTPVTEPVAVQDAPKEVKPTVTTPEAVKPLEKPTKPESIRSAAFKFPDGTIHESTSHPQASVELKEQGKDFRIAEDGFVTSEGRFVGRDEAAQIAKQAEQVSAKQEGQLSAHDISPFGIQPAPPPKTEIAKAQVEPPVTEQVTEPAEIQEPLPTEPITVKSETNEPVTVEPAPKPQPVATANTSQEVDNAVQTTTRHTSARQADIAEDRKAMGLDGAASKERKTWQESLSQARIKEVPRKAQRIAKEVNDVPRPLNDEETAGLVIEATNLKNDYSKTMGRLQKATDPTAIKNLSAEAERIEGEFDTLSRAINISGTEKGRALAAQKLTINQDYDLISVKNRAKSAKQADLTTRESRGFEKLTKQLDTAIAKIDDLQAQLDNMKAQNFVRRGGLKRYKRMNLQQKNAELAILVAKANQLQKEGC